MYVLTYTYMYIYYCTMHAAPHPLEYTDIATYIGLVCLALLINYAYAYVTKTTLPFQPEFLFAYRSSTIHWLTSTTAQTRSQY